MTTGSLPTDSALSLRESQVCSADVQPITEHKVAHLDTIVGH